MDLISRQDAIDALFELYEYQRAFDPTEAADLVRQGIYLAEKKIEQLPSAQPDKRLEKIADLVEGTIDHFDRDDAMDLLYQIKEVLNER